MTKLYFFWKTGSVPSGYTNETGWNDRYVYFGNSYGSHGVTGGTDNHSHSPSSVDYGYTQYADARDGEPGYPEYGLHVLGHSHAGSGLSIGSASNLPSYYTLQLISIDLTTWENTVRKFPVGAIVMSESALSHFEMSRFTSADGRLIRINTSGSTSGSDTNTHSVSCNLDTFDQSAQHNYDGLGVYRHWTKSHTTYPYGHTHTDSGNSGSSTSIPKHLTTRLYEIITDSGRAASGVICFVDGTPSSYWDLVSSWNDNFLMPGDQSAVSSGSHTHSHSVSITSSASAVDTDYNTPGNYSCNTVVYPHTHQLTMTLDAAYHLPYYVTLIPVKLNMTLDFGRRGYAVLL